jgi:hypothetical protein
MYKKVQNKQKIVVESIFIPTMFHVVENVQIVYFFRIF